MVRLRAFKAIDDLPSCQKFLDGHKRVLKSVGVTEVTSASEDWLKNPDVYVIIVESLDKEKVFGGARIHGYNRVYQLPIEEATGDMDPKIYKVVEGLSEEGTGEVCGLWNSLEVAGQGIGSIYAIRAAVAISSMIGLKSLFALCSPFTTRICRNYGFEVVKSLGKDGTFYYPKSDLLATVTLQRNTYTLENSNEAECNRIFDLRNRPNQKTLEKGRKQDVEIKYQLEFPIK